MATKDKMIVVEFGERKAYLIRKITVKFDEKKHTVQTVAYELIRLAGLFECVVEATWNGVLLTSDSITDVDGLMRYYFGVIDNRGRDGSKA